MVIFRQRSTINLQYLAVVVTLFLVMDTTNTELEIRRNPPDWLTVMETSIYMQVSDRHVRELVNTGKLRHSRPTQKILIKLEWIKDYLERKESK